ncbi:hypothetical protein Pan216_27440 [Planctomycetes bacterium Pan216]|uniref:Biopolymer transport protein ExbD/TolR n=1 Tax=Kolteria novifilia TaxID=2527975 RepID=A0A518B4G0_9BACT|nr:hypothetical protein Pan216_27440 [Planctomycetes bacterium Pan216]
MRFLRRNMGIAVAMCFLAGVLFGWRLPGLGPGTATEATPANAVAPALPTVTPRPVLPTPTVTLTSASELDPTITVKIDGDDLLVDGQPTPASQIAQKALDRQARVIIVRTPDAKRRTRESLITALDSRQIDYLLR